MQLYDVVPSFLYQANHSVLSMSTYFFPMASNRYLAYIWVIMLILIALRPLTVSTHIVTLCEGLRELQVNMFTWSDLVYIFSLLPWVFPSGS